MTFDALISAFLNYIKVEKGLAANTIAAYTRDLRKFQAYAQDQKLSPEDVERGHLIDYFSSLYREHLDSKSVARHLVSLRNFFRFAQVQELVSVDPSMHLESPKIRRSLPGHLRLEEVERLLAQPDAKLLTGGSPPRMKRNSTNSARPENGKSAPPHSPRRWA